MPITNEQKQAIINQRIEQFEMDIFTASLNKSVAEFNGDVALAETHQAAIDSYQASIEVHRQELAALGNA